MKKQTSAHDTQELREFAEVLRGRRTIDLYLQTPVEKELITTAIEIATWAPNHHVTEPWHFYLMGSETINRCVELLREIVTAKKGADAGDFKAKSWSEKPGWLAVTCRKCDDELQQQEDYAACAAAVQNLALYLWKAGVGSKWTTGDITRDKRFAEIVDFDPETEFVVGLIWYGYAKLTPTQSRTGLANVLTTLL